MSRDYDLFLQDILQAARQIETYTAGLSYAEFVESPLIYDAVLYNLMIIGEAVKNIPDEVRASYAEIEWRRIAGLRDFLVHVYFGIDLEIIWNIVQSNVPHLRQAIEQSLPDEPEGDT